MYQKRANYRKLFRETDEYSVFTKMQILNSFNSSHVLLHSGDLFELGCIVCSPHNSVVAK